ncbi:hypothetical protein M422DRAFT_253209 [Sphaerobolus stellatus SS14]|uniref:Uncharacterized protein n=1 Tax=Sphaerobolus stellatus (strain SS14) TaxID=990650 RepID=A0A0C9VNL7_SPHS4|nr:hypothetical protein M422DRAFT_253209 [Sphaerobolus stellatus SS14]
MSKIYFALSFLWGAALECFELAVMVDYPNKDDQPLILEKLKANFEAASPEEDMETALEELKMEKHHQAIWFFISFAKYKVKTAYNDCSYYCLVMNAIPNWILEELHRVFPMPKSYETLHSMILQIDQCYWNHKKIMGLCQKEAPKPPVAMTLTPPRNNNQSGNNKSKDNKSNSNKGKTNTTTTAGASSSKIIKDHVGQDCRKAKWNQNNSSGSNPHLVLKMQASITEEKAKTDDKVKAKGSSGLKN